MSQVKQKWVPKFRALARKDLRMELKQDVIDGPKGWKPELIINEYLPKQFSSINM